MKNASIFKVILLISIFLISSQVKSQTCIDYTDTKTPWTNIPYFDGSESYINIKDSEVSSNTKSWFQGSFSLDTWFKCTWPDDSSSDDDYFLFGAGPWDDDNNSFMIWFEETSEGNWRIRLTDGNDSGGNTDILYSIDYDGDYMNTWKHIAITYDDATMRIYIDGVYVKGGSFVYNVIPDEYCTLGGHRANHSEDFRGYISGFRLWTDIKLSSTEVDYIWDKTFNKLETFVDDKQYLHDNLMVNMFTDVDNIYSLNYETSHVGMSEYGIDRTSVEHPARPPRAFDMVVTEDYDEIKLDWEAGTNYATYYVYRRKAEDSGWGTLLCRTNSTYYNDDETTLEGGQEYQYSVRAHWYNAEDPLQTYSGYYDSQDALRPIAKLKAHDNVENLLVDVDASSGDCNGLIKIKWDALGSDPPSYKIFYSIEGGTWQTLADGITTTQYTHTVSDSDLAKDISYKVDANGDKYLHYSNTVTGQANKICITAPTAVASAINGNNIDVTWDFTQLGAPATGFKIYRSVAGSAFEIYVSSINVDDRSYTDKNKKNCTSYKYKIEAYNQCGASNSLSAESNATVLPDQFGNVFTYDSSPYFDGSKGYYNQKVTLEWEANPDQLGAIEKFEIYRRKDGESYSLLTTIENANATSYEDVSTEANLMYEYKIQAKGDCSGSETTSDFLETVGFRRNTGIVAGKITYEGGNAVKDAEVRISTEDAVTVRSLDFNGLNDYLSSANFVDDSIYHHPLSVDMWVKPELDVSGSRKFLFSVQGGLYYMAVVNMTPMVCLNLNKVGSILTESPIAVIYGDTLLTPTEWVHLSSNFDPENGVLELYVNGEKVNSTIYLAPQIPWAIEGAENADFSDYELILGSPNKTRDFFAGNIDEVRIWQRFRSEEEIKRDYTRVLTGKEEGLIGYYPLDEGFRYSAYDLSKADQEFNKNDFYNGSGKDSYFPNWAEITPSFEQLHPSGVTDVNGNYIIEGVQYAGTGSIFNVSPTLGVHEFAPTDINLYIGDSEPVHNGIDFIDKSSFRFVGKIQYQNTNFPVEGAGIFIDNQQIFDAGGRPVLTDEYGGIDISVPIGEHYISVKKNKHVFVDNGQWPAPLDGNPYPKFNFQDNVYDRNFYDSTTVKLCGRFVGGNVEGEKTIGFGKSNNNIGVGQIVFENEIGYDIDFAENGKDTAAVSIDTDVESGEYEIYMLPEKYTIVSAENDHYTMDQLDLGTLDLTKAIDQEIVISDTTYIEEINGDDTTYTMQVEEYRYNQQRNFIIYTEPGIEVYGKDDGEFTGELILIATNPSTEEKDTLDIQTNSPFNYPVFKMTKTYDIDIRVNSSYTNYDGDKDIIDLVPIEDAEIDITNNLEIGEPSYSYSSDSEGKVPDYTSFRVGLPNMNKDESNATSFTKTITITAKTDNYNVSWREGDIFRAYVLGGVDAGGANFVTYGPEITQFILRDPPGSHSYTYLEKESVYSSSRSFNFSTGSTSTYDNTLMLGVKFEVGGGLAGPVFTSEVQTDVNAGIEAANYLDRSGEFRTTFRFLSSYSTSDEENMVGSMADVYIGRSTNMYFTETENLRLFPKSYCDTSGYEFLGDTELADTSLDYTFGIKPGFAVSDDESSTLFVYSQDHILNSMLPEYRDMIYNLMNSSKYKSNVSSDHLYYGMANDSVLWYGSDNWAADSLHPSYEFLGEEHEVDSVGFLNQQISIWLQTVALNEAAKLNSNMDQVENISYDGGAGPYINELSTTEEEVDHKEYYHRFSFFGGAASGFTLNKFGVATYSQKQMDFEMGLGETDETTKTLTWGYVLDDDNQGDYFSVDVLRHNIGVMDEGTEYFLNENNYEESGKNLDNMIIGTGAGGVGIFVASTVLSKLVNPLAGQALSMAYTTATSAAFLGVMGHYKNDIKDEDANFGLKGASPIFRLRGGQSRCPHEPEEYTSMFFDPDTQEPFQLHTGTQNHEAPKLAIEPASIINVPDGSKAVFELKLMNESPTDKDLTYELMVDENSNPDGAEIRIDGLEPNRPFLVRAGEVLTKTLTVERAYSNEMEFNDLQMILHSTCQFNVEDNMTDISDTVSFSAHFIPVCTEVTFGNISDDWVLNVYDNDVLPINVTGYDINQSTFRKIVFQYSQAGGTPTTAMTIYKLQDDYDLADEPKLYLDNKADIDFDFEVDALVDGEYSLHLTTVCSDGSVTENDKVTGTIDRITPKPFGTPQPADGVLSPGDEISLKFNEEINEGLLYAHPDYISVRGIPNGTDLIDNPSLLHDASLHFDGNANYMRVSDGVNLDHTSFTLEFWLKRERNGKECVVSLGYPSIGGLWIGFDETDHFVIQAGPTKLISDNTYEDKFGQWMHIACVYNIGDESTEAGLTAIIALDAETEEKYKQGRIYTSMEDALYLGYCPEDASAFNGNIHEFRIWNTYRTIVTISAQKGKLLNGHEQGLYGWWPMNEANGEIAHDRAGGKNARFVANWHVSREGKSIQFDAGSNTYLEIPTGQMAFDTQSDFTLEFWYKTAIPAAEVCLMSNGNGDGVISQDAWSISADANAKMLIRNNGETVSFDAEDYLDNTWHHIALSLNRLGYLSVYADGELVANTSSSKFEGFGASKLVFGAQWYELSMQHYYSNYFTGYIDEIRVWNSSRGKEQIQRYMNHALTGAEYGLKAYFPFEDVRIEDPSISNETLENLTEDDIAVAGDAVLINGADFSVEAPYIKLQRAEQNLPFTYVINADELIINPTMDDADIENVILDISVRRVKDLFNNQMASTVTWSAYVDKNQLVWDMQSLSIEKLVDDRISFFVNVINKSGQNENFDITNIPVWLDVNPESGSLSPLQSKEIELTIQPELNIGTYTRDINLVSSMGYNERLELNVNVKGTVPDWDVNPADYEYSASVLAQVYIDDIISTDVEDMVACFINGECRGVANIQYFETGGIYLLFLDVYDNTFSGAEMAFKIYDASTGKIYADVTPVLAFKSNEVYGSTTAPVEINSNNYVEQHMGLNSGWTWISFNVYNESFDDIDLTFADMQAEDGDFIKSFLPFVRYDIDAWYGNLFSVNNREMYKVKAALEHEFTVTGKQILSDTLEIPIGIDWNWIGYPLSNRSTVVEAMSSLDSEVDDILKSQRGYAIYDASLGWIGSLNYLMPSNGYMLRSGKIGTLIYSSALKQSEIYTEEEPVYDLPATPTNMTMLVALDLPNAEQYTLIAYDDQGICGYAESTLINETEVRFFLTINSENAREIKFVAQEGRELLTANEIVSFVENEHRGSVNLPFKFSFSTTDVSDILTDEISLQPNPFKNELHLHFTNPKQQNVNIQLLDVLGEIVAQKEFSEYPQGNYDWDLVQVLEAAKEMPSGVYFVNIKLGNDLKIMRIVKN